MSYLPGIYHTEFMENYLAIFEAVLFPEQGQDVLLERLRELAARIGLEMDGNISRVHMEVLAVLRFGRNFTDVGQRFTIRGCTMFVKPIGLMG